MLLTPDGKVGKGQMVADVVQEESRHGLGILQVALLELLFILGCELFFQQALFFRRAANGVLHPDDEVLPPLTL